MDRFGREPVILAGAGVLLGSALISGSAPADSVVVLSVGLFLLGLGWSCTLIAGSTLLTDDVDPADRPAIQGLADLVMNVAGAAGGVIAGVVVIASSYTVLCFAAALPVLALLLMVRFVRRAG